MGNKIKSPSLTISSTNSTDPRYGSRHQLRPHHGFRTSFINFTLILDRSSNPDLTSLDNFLHTALLNKNNTIGRDEGESAVKVRMHLVHNLNAMV